MAEVFPGAAWQRCIVHLERDVAGWVPTRRDRSRARAALKAVFAERDPALVRAAYHRACAKVSALSRRAGEPLGDAEEDALAYLDFPREHHLRLRTDNIQERANEEIKHRTRVVNVFPSVGAMERLVGSVLIDVNEEWMSMGFIDAASLSGELRSPRAHAEPSPEVEERARLIVAEAIESAGRDPRTSPRSRLTLADRAAIQEGTGQGRSMRSIASDLGFSQHDRLPRGEAGLQRRDLPLREGGRARLASGRGGPGEASSRATPCRGPTWPSASSARGCPGRSPSA